MILVYLLISGLIMRLDLKNRLVPDWLTLPGCVIGILLNTWLPNHIGLHDSVEGMLLGWVVLFIAGMAGFLIDPLKPSLGGGDLKFMAMIGAFFGVKVVILTFLFSPILGSIWAMRYLQTGSPYTVFLFIGSIISLTMEFLWKILK